MHKKPCLGLNELITIARMTAERHKLKMPTEARIMENFKSGSASRLPVVVECPHGILWIDKFYVAYQIGTGVVHYTYLTREHIQEEVKSYKEANAEMPKDIEHCFLVGVAGMKKRNTWIWLAKDYCEGLDIDC